MLALPSLLGAVIAMWLAIDRVSTRVEMTVMANRVRFVIGDRGPVQVLDVPAFRSAQVTRFSRVLMRPAVLERLDPAVAAHDFATAPAAAWTRWTPGPEVVITGPRPEWHPAVTIEPEQAAESGSLKLAPAQPGSAVALETAGGKRAVYLAFFLNSAGSTAYVDPSPRAYVLVTNGRIAGIDLSEPAASETFRIAQSPANPFLTVEGGPDSLGLNLEFQLAALVSGMPLTTQPIPVTRIDFERQAMSGERLSTLLADTKVRYLDYPALAPRTIPAHYFLRATPEAAFEITTIALVREGERAAITLRLSGNASGLRSGTASDSTPIDYRLTRFEILRQDPTWTAVFAVVVWVFGTAVGARKLWKELNE